MSDRIKGTITGIVLSMVAVVLWIILVAMGFIAGIAGALIGILFMIGYKSANPSDKSNYAVIAACIVIIVGIVLAELFTVAILASLYEVSYAELMSMPDVRLAMLFDVVLGLIFSFVIFGLYLFATKKNNNLDHKRVRTDKPE
jgi:hypothetical protein